MNGNGKGFSTVSWIAIIMSVVIASFGILLGSIRTTSSEAIALTRAKLDTQDARITALEIRYERIDERLSNILKLLEMHASE